MLDTKEVSGDLVQGEFRRIYYIENDNGSVVQV